MNKTKKPANHNEDKFLDNYRYKIISEIGSGGFACVYKAKDSHTKTLVAIKKLDYTKEVFHQNKSHNFFQKFVQMLAKESTIMKSLQHPNIVKFYDFVESIDDIFIVMEFVPGGELLHKIQSKKRFTEADSIHILKQLIEAVCYLHGLGYVHRDIKPENILFETYDIKSTLKLCDFGICRKYNKNMLTLCGTIQYSAPELLKSHINFHGYGNEVDIWSIGVIAYLMLGGYCPFYSKTNDDQEIKKMILSCKYKFHYSKWKYISQEAKDFIKSILEIDPHQRLVLEDALKSRWFQNDRRRQSCYSDLSRSTVDFSELENINA